MALYYYFKKEIKISPLRPLPGKIEVKTTLRLDKMQLSPARFSTPLSLMFIAAGISMLLLVVWPIAKWQLLQDEVAPEQKLVKPLPQERNEVGRVFALEDEKKDLTQASNWFPTSPQKSKEQKISEYTISIPKLKIKDATALVGGEDLTKSLIHYGGSALPGEYGNAVIFGHSVLPEFFDPKNYTTIFATLPEIKIGDEVFATVDNVTYKYVVYELKTVAPDDISVLEQRYDNYYMTLITCVPPGLKWKRLVVKAKLEPLEEEPEVAP